MFYDIYESLCKERSIRPNTVAKELSISSASVTNWKKNGYTPRGNILNKIAVYFGVSTDYLLGKTDIEKEATQNEQPLTPAQQELFNTVKGLSVDEIKDVRKYAEFVKSQHKE